MKKFKYIIATLFVVAVGAGIFWACQKENENSIENQSVENKTQKTFNDNDYIDSLSEITGIDIIELSQKMYIEDFNNILEIHTNKLSNGIINKVIDSNYFYNFSNRVNQNATNIDSIWSYYQEYSLLSYDDSSLTIVTLPENGISYMCMNNQLQDLSIAVNNLCNNITNNFPIFNTLNQEMKIRVIAEALCYGRCEDELNKDLKHAQTIYALEMILCVSGGIGGAFVPFVGGALGPLTYFACATAAAIALEDAINAAYDK